MKSALRRALLGTLIAAALSLTARETVTATALMPAVAASMAPGPISASAGQTYCWYCGRYEGSSVNPDTFEWEPVVYAYCEEWQVVPPTYTGGAWFCNEPLNGWNIANEWEGDVCEMSPHNEQNHPCNCTFEALLDWPDDPLTIDNCEPNSPAMIVAADGFIARTRTINTDEASPPEDERMCNGIVTGVVVSTAAAHRRQRASNLII